MDHVKLTGLFFSCKLY